MGIVIAVIAVVLAAGFGVVYFIKKRSKSQPTAGNSPQNNLGDQVYFNNVLGKEAADDELYDEIPSATSNPTYGDDENGKGNILFLSEA